MGQSRDKGQASDRMRDKREKRKANGRVCNGDDGFTPPNIEAATAECERSTAPELH